MPEMDFPQNRFHRHTRWDCISLGRIRARLPPPSNEDSDIFYIRLVEEGSGFAALESEPVLVSNNPIDDAAGRADPNNARSIQPTIASANDKIYIAWEDTTPAIESDTDSDIFIHSFQDGVIQEFRDGLSGTYRKHFKFAAGLSTPSRRWTGHADLHRTRLVEFL